jgi:hypothetical protein
MIVTLIVFVCSLYSAGECKNVEHSESFPSFEACQSRIDELQEQDSPMPDVKVIGYTCRDVTDED